MDVASKELVELSAPWSELTGKPKNQIMGMAHAKGRAEPTRKTKR